MPGRASIVGAASTHVGKVREHNEDAHFFDAVSGVFVVCDGMGGHAAGEVASALAIQTLRVRWSDEATRKVSDEWLARGTADAKKQLLGVIRDGVIAAHNAIVAEGERDQTKKGMGTTLVGGMIVGGELVFAHAGDSRAYIVRDSIAMQLTEDHTLLSRLLAAGIDVDLTGDGARFRSMLTNALGIGQECKVSTFVVPLADGDRFMLCSDGISEYVTEAEVGEVLSKQPSPARAAQKLVDMALDRGGGDNATAIVVRVLEAGETPIPAEQRRRDDLAISLCELWGTRMSPQQRLRSLRIAIPRDYGADEKIPANTLGDRVAWIIIEGELMQEGDLIGPGGFLYPESLIAGSAAPDKDGLAVAKTDVRALALRSDDFRELCEDDTDLGEAILEGLAGVMSSRPLRASPWGSANAKMGFATTDPNIMVGPRPAAPQTLGGSPDDPDSVTVLKTAGSDDEPDSVTVVRSDLVDDEATGDTTVKRPASQNDAHEVTVLERPVPMRAQAELAPVPAGVEPEPETCIELEADDPPDVPEEPDLTRAALLTGGAGSARVTQTVTVSETSSQTLTVIVDDDEEPAKRPRAITSNESAEASGTIPERPDAKTPDPRSGRRSEGWDD